MADLSAFPVARRWPARHPDRIQLYSFPTPNGVKVSIALEELGLPYEAHLVDLTKNETHAPEFLALNPNGKIPAIIDPDGPGKQPLALFEFGRHPGLSGGQDRPADAGRGGGALRDPAVGVLPDGVCRPNVRAVRILP